LFRMDRWLSVGIISQKQRKDGHHKRWKAALESN
jgi:hypothetical protein